MLDFNKLIDNHIKKEIKPRSVGRYYPSDAGMCMRKVWYSYTHPQEIRPELAKIFEMGHIIHDFIVSVLRSEKNSEIELIQSELPIKQKIEDFEISGRVDDIILVKGDGKLYLVEVKSAKSLFYLDAPANHNISQIQLYMHLTGIHDGFILYVDKTNLQTKAFHIKFHQAEAERIINRFRALHYQLKNRILPDAEARFNRDISWMCNYCEYKERCDKNER